MTSRHAKRAKKKRRVLVEAAIPPDVREELSAGLIQIVEEYFRDLLTRPMESYGTDEFDTRRVFARRKATEFLGRGPAVLEDRAVREILAIAFADNEIQATFTGDFYKELEKIVATGLAVGIYKLLQAVESSVAKLPNDALANFALGDDGAETFRTLADEFTGTFDELVEVAQTL